MLFLIGREGVSGLDEKRLRGHTMVRVAVYDDANVFAKSLLGAIPAGEVFKEEYMLPFHDIAWPVAMHVPAVSLADFSACAIMAEQATLARALDHMAYEFMIDGKARRI